MLSVKLPDTAGKTLYFPTLQTCQQGQTDWSQIPKEGQDEESLKSPAPSVTVTEAEAGGDGHTAHAAGTESSATESSAAGAQAAGAQAASGDDGGAQARSWGALAAGLGGLALGGAAFVRGRAKNGNAAARE